MTLVIKIINLFNDYFKALKLVCYMNKTSCLFKKDNILALKTIIKDLLYSQNSH